MQRRVRVDFFVVTLLLFIGLGGMRAGAQVKPDAAMPRPVAQVDRVPAAADFSVKSKLQGHVPAWANAGREVAGHAVDLGSAIRVSLTLQRDPAVQAAFDQLLLDQQDRNSPMYHHWLTAQEVGELYGPTQHDVDAVVSWLGSQGLTVIDVAPSRMLIDSEASAAVVGNAFQTSFAYYQVGSAENMVERRAARTEPMVPAALAPVIGVVGGMSEVIAEPQSHTVTVPMPEWLKKKVGGGVVSPDYTDVVNSTYWVTAGDFDTIYDINSVVTGGNTGAAIGSVTNANCPVTTAQCIAIIGRSKVTTADITSYMSMFGANGETSYNLTQTPVPAGSGGLDAGIAYTGDTSEATLDVERVVGTANGAHAVLVESATNAGTDGVTIAINYNVNTLQYPVMTISFGSCENGVSSATESAMNTIFAQAASEGISTFVSAGDSAAAGCDTHGSAPPGTQVLSANYLCASGSVTCVGGTEFAEASSYETYWNSANGTQDLTAKSYIPEGAWNEPGTAGSYVVDGTGGGVSIYTTKPSFQTGTGVPADGYRDTPDVSFTAAGSHDPYVGCETPSSGSTSNCAGGYLSLSGGTSASAPGMAGIAALLNTRMGAKQGALNTKIYSLASATSSVFHDVTVASSGVATCTETPSMCNNSTAGSASSLSGGLSGYLVTTGYDQATGWGSLDVANYLIAVAGTDLTVSSAHTGNFAAGSTGDVYTLTVTNVSDVATSGTISVVDTLPSGFTATALSGTGWTCTLGTLTCTMSTALAANTGAAAITLTVSVSSGDAGTYTNTVAVSLAGTLSQTSTDSTVVGPLLAPKLVISFTPAAIAVGGSTVWSMTYSNPNSSGATITGVAYTDYLPPNISISSLSQFACTASPTASGSGVDGTYGSSSYAGTSGASLAPSGYCIFSFNVTASAAGSYPTTSSAITSTNAGSGAAATATLIVGAELNAASTHTGTFKAASTGDTFTLTVTNNASSGAATSGTVTVVDTLPTGFTATAMTGTGWTCTLATVSCTSTTAEAVGASFPAITLTASVASTDVGTYTNSVVASGGGGFSGGVGTDSVLVIGVPTIMAAFSPTTVAPGAHPTLTFTITNPNTTTALAGLGLVNNLPANLTNYSSAGGTCGGTGAASSTQEYFSGATLAASSSCTFIVTVTAGSTLGTTTDTSNAVTSTTSNAGGTGTANLTVAVTPTKLVYTTAPATPITAGGNSGTFTVALEDAAGNINTADSSSQVTVTVTATGYLNTYTGTASSGVATFSLSSIALTIAKTYTYTATLSGLTTAVATEVVNAGTESALGISSVGPYTYPGTAGTATVTALDSYGNTATSFRGTVSITSSDTTATLPSAYTYVGGDSGVHAFSVTLNTAGTYTVTAKSGGATAVASGVVVEYAIWLVDKTGVVVKLSSAGGLVTSAGSGGTASTVGGVAMDSTGNVWSVESGVNSLLFATKAGTGATSYTGGGLNAPASVAVDGAGYIWVANSGNKTLSEFTSSGGTKSGTAGYNGSSIGTGPSGVAIDKAGGVWVVSKTGSSVTHVLGSAAPVTTPLATAAKNATLGTEP